VALRTRGGAGFDITPSPSRGRSSGQIPARWCLPSTSAAARQSWSASTTAKGPRKPRRLHRAVNPRAPPAVEFMFANPDESADIIAKAYISLPRWPRSAVRIFSRA